MSDKKRILIIDDEPMTLELLYEVLTREGYEVVQADNGVEGVKLFKEQPCDLLVTDMVMPVQDGLQTIFELRNDYPRLPVIAISAGGTVPKERYLAVAGYLDRIQTIPKPFAPAELIKVVKEQLQLDD